MDMKKSSVPLEYFEAWLETNGFGIVFSGQLQVCERIDELIQNRPIQQSAYSQSDSDTFFSKPLDELLAHHAPKDLRQAMHILSRLSRELHETSDIRRSRSRRSMHRDGSSKDLNVPKLTLMNALLETVYLAADTHEIRTQRKAVIQRADAIAESIAARRLPPSDAPNQASDSAKAGSDDGGGGGGGGGGSTPDRLRADAAPPETAADGRQVLKAAWAALHRVDPAVARGGAGLAARGTYLMYLAARVAEVEALCAGLPAAQGGPLLNDPVNGARALSCEIQAARKAAAAAAAAAGGPRAAQMV